MAKLLVFFFSVILFTAKSFAVPRLVVFIVVDQLRPDQLVSNHLAFDHGYKTFIDQGAVFLRARYDYFPTNTAPGHALLLTGEAPHRSGIIDNVWFDKDLDKAIKCTFDEKHNQSPKNLWVPTLGDQLKSKNRASKVVSLSLKSRSAILMGGKKADLVLWHDLEKSEFVSSSYYIQGREWVLDFNRQLKKGMLPSAKAPKTQREAYLWSHQSDRNLRDLSLLAIEKLSLGKDEVTDLLCLSFSAHDYVGHKFGPFGKEMDQHMQKFDLLLGELLTKIQTLMNNQEVLFVLTSDHGVLPLPENPFGKKMAAKRVSSKDFRKKIKKALGKDKKHVRFIRPPNLYFKKASLPKLKKWAKKIKSIPEIEQVYIPGHWPDQDPYLEFAKQGYAPGRSGNLIIRLKPAVMVRRGGSGTTHGSPYDYDAVVPLVFLGNSINPQKSASLVHLSDLAPSLAELTGTAFSKNPANRELCQALGCP